MENILSQLRKSTQKSTKTEKEPIEDKSVFIDLSSTADTDSSIITPFTIMKIDYRRLKNLTREIFISDILESEEYKIFKTTALIVKKIEKFSDEICSIEMVDETGTIGCSCMYSLIKKFDIKIGSIVKLKDFSLWKIRGNHINLVKKNIVEVFTD